MGEDTQIYLFESLRGVVSPSTMKAIESFGFGTMTEIQALSLPPLLEGKDLRGTAKTGSGKTLAFLIPAIERLHKLGFRQIEGTGVLVLSPTRELAMQIHAVTQQFLKVHNENSHSGCNWLTCGVLTGGADRPQEKRFLKKGSCILIATPGRLLDHLHNTESFNLKSLKCLVLDEADKMLDKHFEDAMMNILNILPKERQTMLFSATKTPKTNELVAVALKENFVDVDASAKKGSVTVNTLKQAYVVCPTEKKFLFLYNIIKSFEKQRKMMVFFSSCDAVKFYYELLTFVQVDVLCIHGKQEQAQRTKSFNEFTSASSATLLCTDVAARGWDIPEVDYVLQYDPPHDPSEYIHRVGRTARADRSGEALLLLRQEELPFVRCLEKRRALLTEQVLNVANLPDEQKKVEGLVEGTPFLKWWAKKAWKASIHSYTLHKRKDIFNIYNLDIKKLGKSFGFSEPPKVDLAIEYKKSGEKKLLKRIREGYYDDAYERSNKEAALEDEQSFIGNSVADRVKENEGECTVNTVEDNRKKKRNKYKKRFVDDEDNVLKETEKTEQKRNRKEEKTIKRSGDEDDVLKETEEIERNRNKKKKKYKKRSVDDEDVLKETEETEHNRNKKEKKSKKRSVDDEDDVLKETKEIEQNGNKKKKKSNIRSVDDEDVSKETEETEQEGSHKKKHKRRKNGETSCEG